MENIMVMQREQLSPRNQRLLEHLESVWQRQKSLPPDALKHITRLVISFPEEHKAAGLRMLADDVISSMRLHLLGLVEAFKRYAEQEDISLEDRDETLQDTLPEIFNTIKKIDEQLTVRSLDDLTALVNITVSLQSVSQARSADEAQSSLYELASLYYKRLVEEGLLVDAQKTEQDVVSMWHRPVAPFSAWVYFDGHPGPMALSAESVPTVPQCTMPVKVRVVATAQHA